MKEVEKDKLGRSERFTIQIQSKRENAGIAGGILRNGRGGGGGGD